MSNWKPISEAPKNQIIIVAKFGHYIGTWDFIHAAYWADGWALPFNSYRDDVGTPFLGKDEQPTHYMELPKTPIEEGKNGR